MNRHINVVLLLLIMGCNSTKQPVPFNMAGAYTMLSQSFKGAAIDTTFTQHRHLKIYTGDYMMYVRVNPADSVSAFGVGTWAFDSGKLTESIIYSATDNIESTSIFADTANITPKDSGYEKVIPEISSSKDKIRLTEEYRSVGTTATSPIDGVWRQVSGYTLTGKDTVKWTDVQYKAFYAGNFVYGNVSSTAKGEKNTFISYGIFSMNNPHQIKEIITAATAPAMQGQSFNIDITMNGGDSFTQTNTLTNGDKEVIVYERMKKK